MHIFKNMLSIITLSKMCSYQDEFDSYKIIKLCFKPKLYGKVGENGPSTKDKEPQVNKEC